MQSRRQRTLAWLFLIAYALTSAVWAKGLVLCFEADGHVTIEAATNCSDCCSEDGASESAGVPRDGQREAPALSACACQDVALSVGNSTAAKKSAAAELQRVPLALFVPKGWPPYRQAICAPSFDLPRSHSSSVLAFLSSVVLRV